MTAGSNTSAKRIQSLSCMVLMFLLILFCLRVVGQLLVALFGVPFLPPMEEWFSGAIPYPELLIGQILIITLYGKVCVDFARGYGIFVKPNPRFGKFLLQFGTFYLSIMLLRYAVRMGLYPAERWTGGCIPIFFHWILASFLLVLGRYHLLQPSSTSGAIIGSTWKKAERGEGETNSKHNITRRATAWGLRTLIGSAVLAWFGWQLLPSFLAYKSGLRPPLYAVRTQKSVALITIDGIKLVADVYHPQHIRKTPTILVRIPLTKSLRNLLYADLIARIWAERGYTVVIQGTRGRFGSSGTFYPLRGERQDGVETLEWLKRQPWFNGQIAMWGGSAFGYTQWVVCNQLKSGASALDIYESATDFHKMFYPGGAFSLYSALSWALNSAGRDDRPNWPSHDEVFHGASGTPLLDADKRAAGKEIPFFRDWAKHTLKDSYWQDLDASTMFRDLKSPVLLMAGWYDPFLPAQLDDYANVRRFASRDTAKQSRLIIGPWSHAGEVTFPDGSKSEAFRPESFVVSLPWFDQKLSAHQISALKADSPVRIFVMGKNEWRSEQEWPLARTRYTSLYLRSSGNANGSLQDQKLPSYVERSPNRVGETFHTKVTDRAILSLNAAHDDPSDSFTYDPSNPTPTAGGAMIGCNQAIACQDNIERRNDVLLYTTPQLREDLEVTGPVRVVLYASTSAPQTDFTAKLVDVHPDGSAFNVSDGILRKSFKARKSAGTAQQSSAIEKITIDLWPTSMVFNRQHRIRLEISSSNFPRYDRNPNTGAFIPTETRMVSAQQSVFHSALHPSRLILPIIPQDAEQYEPAHTQRIFFK